MIDRKYCVSIIVNFFYTKFIGNINNISMILDRNYTEINSAKRSLGLGLNMVKTICEKYSIDYNAYSEKGINTFTYFFKV